jgi:ferredoxin--NADP+ reductase
MVPRDGDTKARGLGTTRALDVDTVIFCIGDKVDEKFGLPVEWNAYVKNAEPAYPVDDVSYEVFDPVLKQPIRGVFVAGWSRQASSGLVGVTRKDGESGAVAVLQYLQSLAPLADATQILANVNHRLVQLQHPVVSKEDVWKVEAAEQARAESQGVEDFKFDSNAEMLELLTKST